MAHLILPAGKFVFWDWFSHELCKTSLLASLTFWCTCKRRENTVGVNRVGYFNIIISIDARDRPLASIDCSAVES